MVQSFSKVQIHGAVAPQLVTEVIYGREILLPGNDEAYEP